MPHHRRRRHPTRLPHRRQRHHHREQHRLHHVHPLHIRAAIHPPHHIQQRPAGQPIHHLGALRQPPRKHRRRLQQPRGHSPPLPALTRKHKHHARTSRHPTTIPARNHIHRRIPLDHGSQPRPQSRQIVTQHNRPMIKHRPRSRQRPRHIRRRHPDIPVQPTRQPPRLPPQHPLRPTRHHPRHRDSGTIPVPHRPPVTSPTPPGGRQPLFRSLLGRLLQNHVGVGAADTERRHRGPTRPTIPWPGLVDSRQFDGARRPVDLRSGDIHM